MNIECIRRYEYKIKMTVLVTMVNMVSLPYTRKTLTQAVQFVSGVYYYIRPKQGCALYVFHRPIPLYESL